MNRKKEAEQIKQEIIQNPSADKNIYITDEAILYWLEIELESEGFEVEVDADMMGEPILSVNNYLIS